MLSFNENLTESIRMSSSLHVLSNGNESKWSPSQEVDPEINAKI